MGKFRGVGRLTPEFVAGHDIAGKHFDGLNGLILRISPSGARSWVQRIVVHGRKRELGLGGWPMVSLEEARAKAFANRRLARSGGDPGHRTRAITFREAVERVITLHEPSWRNGGKSAGQWRQSMRDYALPTLGSVPVGAIGPSDVISVLAPIWSRKPETARRVRQRIRTTLQWSRAQGYASGPNPVDEAVAALPRQNAAAVHRPSVPHPEVRDALELVFRSHARRSVKLSLAFQVLTAARSGEARMALRSEIDLCLRIWTIPGSRTKTGREHRVPLSSGAVWAVEAAAGGDGGLVAGNGRDRPLWVPQPSDSTHSKLLRELRIPGVPHGFRSSFRDWASEVASAPRELAELSLGHVYYGAAEASYARSDLLERRRPLLEEWSAYVLPEPPDPSGL